MFDGDEPQVADFGFAKLFDETLLKDEVLARRRRTAVGERLGTMAYASPEQISVAPLVSEQADIFSFGVMTYELLTGVLPFPKEETENVEEYRARLCLVNR
jgi:serine/threonine protein kinase